MFGESIDTLNMYTESVHGTVIHVWSLSGHQINKWQPAQYTLYSYNPTRLWIEGIAGGSITGDIAIDDLKLVAGACPPDVSAKFT